MFLIAISLFFSIPSVRWYLARKAVAYLNTRYDVDIRIKALNLFPLGHVDAQDVLILDHHQDTLIYSKRLITNIFNLFPLTENKFLFASARLKAPYLNLVTYEGESEDNLNVFIRKLEGENKSATGRPFYMKISGISWNDGRFFIRNYNVKKEPLYYLTRIDASAGDFVIDGKNVYVQLENMSFRDKYHIDVSNFKTAFSYTPDSMRFENLLIRTASSELSGRLGFNYSLENLKHFFDEVEWEGRLEGFLSAEDLNKISGKIFKPATRLQVQTRIEGVFNELELTEYKIQVPGTSLKSEGDLIFYELTQREHFGFKAGLKHLRADYEGLKNFLPGITRKYIPRWVDNAGMIRLKGRFEYQPDALNADLTVLSEAGSLIAEFDMNFKENKTLYNGFFRPQALNVGRLFTWKEVGKISGMYQVEGQNFAWDNVSAVVEGKTERIELKHYAYKNVDIQGRMSRGIFNGKIFINDPALKSVAEGTIDVKSDFNSWKIDTRVLYWDLYRTGWIKSDTLAVLQFHSNFDMQGKSLNDLAGSLRISDLRYRRSGKNYEMKTFVLQTSETGRERIIEIRSDKAVNGYLKGNFKPDRLPAMYMDILGTVFTGLKSRRDYGEDYVRFNLSFDSNLLEILIPSIRYTKKTNIKGTVSGKDRYIHTDLNSETLIYKDIAFYNTKLSIDNQNPIYNLYVKSDSVATGFYTFSDIKAINLTIKDTIYLKLKSKGGAHANDRFNLSAKYHLDSLSALRFTLTESQIFYNNKTWTISPETHTNRIDYYFSKDSLFINDLGIAHDNEALRLWGYETEKTRDITLKINDLKIRGILPETEGFAFDGMMNLSLKSGKNNGRVFYNAGGEVLQLQWNGIPLGDLAINIKTISSETMFLDLKSIHNHTRLLSANGYVDVHSKDLDINLNLNEFPLTPFNALLEDVFSDIRGRITGHTHISGDISNPRYNGVLNLFDAGLKVNELNTDYQFQNREQVSVQGEKFVFNRVNFFDTKYGTQGRLNGEISFYNFTNWFIDLQIDTENLLVLDTGFSQEALYYGTAFAQGNASVKGYVNQIRIDAAVKSRENTRIFIPLSDVETIGEDNYIKFYTEKEYAKKKRNKKNHQRIYEGLQLNLDIDITQDAEIEIVLDQEFGSRLKSLGEGTVLMEINTEGKFNMWGTYSVVEGKYVFRYAGVIEKEFDVEPGSILVWNGDPFRADLDIKATYYIPAADITPLIKDSEIYTRRVPVKVIINIKGDLMKPRIEFALDLPDTNPVIRSEVEYALRDADTRMLQVISLLYSGNFIATDVLKFDNRTAVEGNLSERVLSVFNTLLENDVFNVKLDYVPDRQDPETNVKTDSRVGLTIQTKINKRIYINGKLAMPVGRYTKSSVSGDVEADIWLNENGTIQLRIYNKRTEIEYANQEESYTRGVGLSFQVDFDTFKEFLEKMKISIETEE